MGGQDREVKLCCGGDDGAHHPGLRQARMTGLGRSDPIATSRCGLANGAGTLFHRSTHRHFWRRFADVMRR